MTQAFGAVDLYAGNSVTGTDLFSTNKDPTNTLSTNTGTLSSNPETFVDMLSSMMSNIPELIGVIFEFILLIPIILLEFVVALGVSLLDGLCGIFTGQPQSGTTTSSFLSGTQGAMNNFCGLFTGQAMPLGAAGDTSGATVYAGIQGAISTGSTILVGDTSISSGSGLFTSGQGWMNNMCGAYTGNPNTTGTSANTVYDGVQGAIATGSTALAGNTSISSGSGLASGAQTAANNFCGLFTGNSVPLRGTANTDVPTVFAGVQGAIATGSTLLVGDTSISSGSGLFTGGQGLADGLCGSYTGENTTGTTGNTVYDGVQGAIATGSTVLTGNASTVSSGTGVMAGGINFMDAMCGLCTGGLGISDRGKNRMRGRMGVTLPTPTTNAVAILDGTQSWIATGSYHLTGNPNAITSGTGLATAGQGHLDTVGSLVGLSGAGNTATDVMSQAQQYQSDSLALLGNPTGLGTGNPQAPPVNAIPLLGQQQDITSAPVISAVTSTSWFNDLQLVLGNPTGLGSGSPTANPAISNVPLLGPAAAAQQSLTDYIYGGITGVDTVDNSSAAVGNALSGLATTAKTAATQAQTGVTYVDLMAVNNPGYHAVDTSLSAVFSLTSLTGSSPDTIVVSELASAIGFIHIPAAAMKSSIAFIGVASVSGLIGAYLNLYSVDTTTGLLTEVWQSSNIVTSISTGTYDWVYVQMPPVTVNQGDWWAVELAVEGTGSVTIVGMPNHWLPVNGNTFPQALGAARDTTVPMLDAGSSYASSSSGTSGSWAHTLSDHDGAIYTFLNLTDADATFAPTYDATGTGAAVGNTTSLSWSHTLGADANYITVGLSLDTASAVIPTITAEVGGSAMSVIGSVTDYYTSGNYFHVVMLGLAAPPTGTQTITITLGTASYCAANSVSYSGVTSIEPAVTGTGTGTAASLAVPSLPNSIVMNTFASYTTPFTAYNQNSRYNKAYVASTNISTMMGDAVGGANLDFTATTATAWGGIAVVANGASVTAEIDTTPMTPIAGMQYDLGNPAYDAVGSGFLQTSTVTTCTGSWTHTATAGAAVIVAVVTEVSADLHTTYTRTATYGGEAMTSLGVVDHDNAAVGWVELFGINNVPGGAQTVEISISGGANIYCAAAQSVSYTNVASFGTAVTNHGAATAQTSGTVTSTPDQTVVQAFGAAYGSGVLTQSTYSGAARAAGQVSGATSGNINFTVGDTTGSGGLVLTETNSAAADYASVAVPLNGGARSGSLYVFELDNPPTGAQTVSYSLGAAADVAGSAVSYIGSGVASDASVIATAGAGQALTQTVTAAGGQMLLQAFANHGGTLTGYNQTNVAYEEGTASSGAVITGQTESSGVPQTFQANGSQYLPWGSVIIPIATPYMGAAPTFTPTYSNNVPWLALSSESVTSAGTYAPTTTPYLTPGTYTFVIPFWATFIDLVAVGAGGSGSPSYFLSNGHGGDAGSWSGRIIERSVDFADSPDATLTIVVGAPAGASQPGGQSTITWTDPSNIDHTVTAAGGAAAARSVPSGQAEQNYIFDGELYQGGLNNTAPGGGGDGGIVWGAGARAGGAGAVWLVCRSASGGAREIPVQAFITGTGALSGVASYHGALSGHGALSSLDDPSQRPQLAGQGELAATAPSVGFTLPADLDGQGVLDATAGRRGNLTSQGVLSARAERVSFRGQGALEATANSVEFRIPAALDSQGVLSAQVQGAANLHGHGALTVTALVDVARDLTGQGVLQVTVMPNLAAALTGRGVLTETDVPSLPAALSGHGALSGSLGLRANVRTSSTSLTMSPANYDAYIYTGSTATTWTLPAVSGNTGVVQIVSNRGTGILTINAAGSDRIVAGTSTGTSVVVEAGSSVVFVNDGTYWLVTTQHLA